MIGFGERREAYGKCTKLHLLVFIHYICDQWLALSDLWISQLTKEGGEVPQLRGESENVKTIVKKDNFKGMFNYDVVIIYTICVIDHMSYVQPTTKISNSLSKQRFKIGELNKKIISSLYEVFKTIRFYGTLITSVKTKYFS